MVRRLHQVINALMQFRHEGKSFLWVRTLFDDMVALRTFHSPKLDELPLPLDSMQAWCTFITAFPAAWKEYIRSYIFFTSSALITRRIQIFDHQLVAATSSVTPCTLQPGWFRCQLCDSGACRIFHSERALRAHQVAGHGVRCKIRAYIDADGKCPACGLHFHIRIRAIAHARRRSSACFSNIHSCKPLSDDRISLLDAADAASRKAARKSGHPTPLAILPGPSKGPKKRIAAPIHDPDIIKRGRR